MEVVLPESAELSHIEPSLLAPGKLPDFWKGTDITVADARAYFSGGKVINIARQGYDEPVTTPEAPQAVVDEAIGCAVKEGELWLTQGPTSLLSEEIPAGLLSDEARLQSPPTPIPATDVLASTLSDAWTGETTTALAIADALSVKAGKPLPWATVRTVIDGAFHGRLLERAVDSGPWPFNFDGAGHVKVRGSASKPKLRDDKVKGTRPDLPPGVLVASANLKQMEVQEFADQIGEITNAAVGYDLKILVTIEIGSAGKRPPDDLVGKLNAKLVEVSKDLKLG
jgi:hypothetical protein